MCTLEVSSVTHRQECKSCQYKASGLIGIIPPLLAIKYQVTEKNFKYYHPICFFKNCIDLLKKSSINSAKEIKGYKSLMESDKYLIHGLFVEATDESYQKRSERFEEGSEKIRNTSSKRPMKKREIEKDEVNEEEEENIPKKAKKELKGKTAEMTEKSESSAKTVENNEEMAKIYERVFKKRMNYVEDSIDDELESLSDHDDEESEKQKDVESVTEKKSAPKKLSRKEIRKRKGKVVSNKDDSGYVDED